MVMATTAGVAPSTPDPTILAPTVLAPTILAPPTVFATLARNASLLVPAVLPPIIVVSTPLAVILTCLFFNCRTPPPLMSLLFPSPRVVIQSSLPPSLSPQQTSSASPSLSLPPLSSLQQPSSVSPLLSLPPSPSLPQSPSLPPSSSLLPLSLPPRSSSVAPSTSLSPSLLEQSLHQYRCTHGTYSCCRRGSSPRCTHGIHPLACLVVVIFLAFAWVCRRGIPLFFLNRCISVQF